jgi:primary-amine oxidase
MYALQQNWSKCEGTCCLVRPLRILCALILVLAMFPASVWAQRPANTAHPLDPLSASEIKATVRALKRAGKIGNDSRFVMIHLHEPPKNEVLAFQTGMAFRRESFAVVYNWTTNTTSEAIVDLDRNQVSSWKDIPGAEPWMLQPEENTRTSEIVRKDSRWQEAMRKRGIIELDSVKVLGVPPGPFGEGFADGSRLSLALTAYRKDKLHPHPDLVHGVLALVNHTKKAVVWFADTGSLEQPPDRHDRFDKSKLPPTRGGLRPLRLSQPMGTSFAVRGHEVRWQNWRFRFGMHPRGGLVVYTVGYEDRGKLRPILYRGSLSEMAVPYGDPAWHMWAPFDAGDVGLGYYSRSSFVLEADAPTNTSFFGATYSDPMGNPVVVPRAVALYERDGDTLWRHGGASRRGRELVLASYARVDNYDYGFHWIFHQDGTLEVEVLLTGIMNYYGHEQRQAEALETNAPVAFGTLVAPNIWAPNHQHFFNFRLDMDVDGPAPNTVVEVNTGKPQGDAANPRHDSIATQGALLRSEQDAMRQVDMASNRRWLIMNSSASDSAGRFRGYMLVPGENSVPYAQEDSYLLRRGGFVRAHLWVTPYMPGEMNAAGDYINTAPPGQGLPLWTSANRTIADTDVVVWYTMGITHVPRAEDWPVMPVHKAGFRLVPVGFFSRNPALDVPAPSTGKAHEKP